MTSSTFDCFKIFCTNFLSLYKSYRQIQIALISIWYLLHYNRQYLSCFALFLRKCDNSWTWLYVKSTIKRQIHYPTEKNIVTVRKTVLKQIVFVFPAIIFCGKWNQSNLNSQKSLIQTMKINELKVCGKMMYGHEL